MTEPIAALFAQAKADALAREDREPVLARTRRMLDRLRALGVDVDGPGYNLDRTPRIPDRRRQS